MMQPGLLWFKGQGRERRLPNNAQDQRQSEVTRTMSNLVYATLSFHLHTFICWFNVINANTVF